MYLRPRYVASTCVNWRSGLAFGVGGGLAVRLAAVQLKLTPVWAKAGRYAGQSRPLRVLDRRYRPRSPL